MWVSESTVRKVLAAEGRLLAGNPPREPIARTLWSGWLEWKPNRVWGYDFTHFPRAKRCAVARLPLMSHTIGMWDLEAPVSHRLDGGAVSPLSVLGSAWLLMGQPSVSDRRRIGTGTGPVGAAGDGGIDPDEVSIIELRRLRNPDGVAAPGDSGGRRRHDKRFWVSGHWRQQACGPGRKLRKPLWISPFLKGPQDAPLADTTRVYVWRR